MPKPVTPTDAHAHTPVLMPRLAPVIAHRAGAGSAPENSLAGIHFCAKQNISQLEMDVCLLGDNTPVMFHDPTWERSSSGAGPISRTDWDQASEIALRFEGCTTDERVAKLDQALSLIRHYRLWLNLELKLHHASQASQLARLTADALQRQPIPAEQLLVSSFNHTALLEFHRLLPQIPIASLFIQLPTNWQQKAREVNAQAIHLRADCLKASQANEIKQAGYTLLCFTVNEPELAIRLLNMGVDAVFSDHPDLIRQALQQ